MKNLEHIYLIEGNGSHGTGLYELAVESEKNVINDKTVILDLQKIKDITSSVLLREWWMEGETIKGSAPYLPEEASDAFNDMHDLKKMNPRCIVPKQTVEEIMKLDDCSDELGITEGFAKRIGVDRLCFSSQKKASSYYSRLRNSYMEYDMDRYNR